MCSKEESDFRPASSLTTFSAPLPGCAGSGSGFSWLTCLRASKRAYSEREREREREKGRDRRDRKDRRDRRERVRWCLSACRRSRRLRKGCRCGSTPGWFRFGSWLRKD